MKTKRFHVYFDNMATDDGRNFVITISCKKENDCSDLINIFTRDMIEYLNSDEKTEEKGWERTELTDVSECEGCEIEAPGQLAHMQCPDGCLHSPGCGECDELPYLFENYE